MLPRLLLHLRSVRRMQRLDFLFVNVCFVCVSVCLVNGVW